MWVSLMSTKRVKELFYSATNAKVAFGSDIRSSIEVLREAVILAKDLDDEVWPFVPSYRLAHFLFRKAKSRSDLMEILALVAHSEGSNSIYIQLQSKLLKFAALDRLIRLGHQKYEIEITETQKQIIECIKQQRQTDCRDSRLEDPNQPLQRSFLNTFEYMVYMAGTDYQSLIGIDYDVANTLFPVSSNDVWHIIGPEGFVDEFAYNIEIGKLELERIVGDVVADGWYLLGVTGSGNYLSRANSQDKLENVGLIKVLNKIIRSSQQGALVEDLCKEVVPANYETISDSGGREKPGESQVKKHRQKIEEFFGVQKIFEQKSRGRAGTRWSLVEGVKIYGLVNQKHL